MQRRVANLTKSRKSNQIIFCCIPEKSQKNSNKQILSNRNNFVLDMGMHQHMKQDEINDKMKGHFFFTSYERGRDNCKSVTMHNEYLRYISYIHL